MSTVTMSAGRDKITPRRAIGESMFVAACDLASINIKTPRDVVGTEIVVEKKRNGFLRFCRIVFVVVVVLFFTQTADAQTARKSGAGDEMKDASSVELALNQN